MRTIRLIVRSIILVKKASQINFEIIIKKYLTVSSVRWQSIAHMFAKHGTAISTHHLFSPIEPTSDHAARRAHRLQSEFTYNLTLCFLHTGFAFCTTVCLVCSSRLSCISCKWASLTQLEKCNCRADSSPTHSCFEKFSSLIGVKHTVFAWQTERRVIVYTNAMVIAKQNKIRANLGRNEK